MKTQAARQNRIQTSDGVLFVDDGGIDEGVPVLFAHSFLGSTRHWSNQLEFFRKKRRAVAFDFPSHGRSQKSLSFDFSAERLAADIHAVVDALELDHFVLVGHSMGGSAAIAYAGVHPENVGGLVLAGTPGKSDAKMAQSIISSLESDAYQNVMDQYMNQLLQNSAAGTKEAVMAGMKNMDRETSISIIKSLFQFDPMPALKEYPGPVMIIFSSSENKQPNSLHNQLPGIEGKLIDGTSHWTQLDKPDEFNRIVEEFIQKIQN